MKSYDYDTRLIHYPYLKRACKTEVHECLCSSTLIILILCFALESLTFQ